MAVALADALGAGHSLRARAGRGRRRADRAGGPRACAAWRASLRRARAPRTRWRPCARGSVARLDALVAACLVQRRAGGDLARLLRECAEAFGDQARLEDEVRSATAQARFTGRGGGAAARRRGAARRVGQPRVRRRPVVVPDRVAGGDRAGAPGGRGGGDPAARPGAVVIAAGARLRSRRPGGPGPGPARAGTLPGPRPRPALARWPAGPGCAGPPGRAGDLEPIAAAGRPGGLGPRELMAAKLAARSRRAGRAGRWPRSRRRLGLLIAVAAPAAGFLAPDLWLRRPAADRARAVRRELPALLDLLRVTVDAGRFAGRRPGRGGGAGHGSAGGRVAAVGARGGARRAAGARRWRAWPRRLPQPEVKALCAALDRARRHGAPLGAPSPPRPATRGWRCAAASRRTPPRRARRSSWWWRCCWCPRCC